MFLSFESDDSHAEFNHLVLGVLATKKKKKNREVFISDEERSEENSTPFFVI